MSCPSHSELIALAFATGEGDGAARHVEGCTICTAEISRLREFAGLLALAENGAATGGPCLDEMTIAAAASGGRDALGPAITAHLADCAVCRARLADAIETLNAPEIAAVIDGLRTGRGPGRRRVVWWSRVAALAAAVAAVAIVPRLVLDRDTAPASGARELRDSDPTITRAVAPRVVAPLGAVDDVAAFTWTAVPGATRYGVTLYGRDGSSLWEAQTADTTLRLPETVSLARGVYLFQVDARMSFDRTISSELTEFRLVKEIQ